MSMPEWYAVLPVIGSVRYPKPLVIGPPTGRMNVPSPSAGPPPASTASCGDAIGLRLQRALGFVVLGLRGAERAALLLLRGGGRVAGLRLLRGELVELGLLVGRGRARVVGHLLLPAELRLLLGELRLQADDARGVVLALVGDALEVVLALDQLTGPGRAAEEPDHRRAVAVLVEQDRGAADVVLGLVQLLLGRLGLELEDRGRVAEPVDVGLRGGEPFVRPRPRGWRRRPRWRRAAGARPGPSPARRGRTLGRARLADLLLELLLLVGLLGGHLGDGAHRRAAP